jgi:hypothetical protein
MIKNIMAGNGLAVNGGSVSYPYVPTNSSNPIQGMLRINNQDLQVFDGSTWMNVSMGYPTVELTGEVQSIIQWAREERNRQLERTRLVKDNPALQKALEAIERAESNFDLIAKFVEHDNDSNNVTSGP